MKNTSFITNSLLTLSALAICASGAQAATLFGLTSGPGGDNLVSIDQATGQATQIRSLGQKINGTDLAVRQGKLYTFSDTSDSIREIDPFGATVISDINIGITAQAGEGAIAFNSAGLGYLTNAFTGAGFNNTNQFYSFDIVGGSSTLIGQLTLNGTSQFTVDGLAFSADSSMLYALGQGQSELFSVDVLTGALTIIGDMGVTPNSLYAGITLSEDGTFLYGSINDKLYTIDTGTGAATQVQQQDLAANVSSVSGIAFAVPEPSSALLLGMGGMLLAFPRRRKLRK